jgi:uncharacterized protein (UPF0332 family)
MTFYNAVITHSYYCIFYSVKAYLENKGISVEAPDEHRKSYEALKTFCIDRTLDIELLHSYEDVMLRANSLVRLFRFEKRKRGDFTYKIHAPANRSPAQESLQHANQFLQHIRTLTERNL